MSPAALFVGSLELSAGQIFLTHVVARSEIPVLVDFWALVRPVQDDGPGVCTGSGSDWSHSSVWPNSTTEAEQGWRGSMASAVFPTLVLFKNGREVARPGGSHGAQDSAGHVGMLDVGIGAPSHQAPGMLVRSIRRMVMCLHRWLVRFG